mmetsp:Transcript_15563/g.43007  ORF Transcript_15563/g.43007 Transcript_15563/m.43007 type:complete len:292 (+) Transcript_15563:526-1401(+)
MARISDASAICFRRSALAHAMRAGSALFLSAFSMDWFMNSWMFRKSSRLVMVWTCMALPSWISDSSFALARRHWCMSLQSTGLPCAAAMAELSSSSWCTCSAWVSCCSASWIMSLTSVHHVTGFRRSTAVGDSCTVCWTTAASEKTSTVQRQRYLSTFEENCLPVTLQEVVFMALCSRSCTSGTVQRRNGVCPRSFFAKTSTPAAIRHSTHCNEPPAAAWCNGVFPIASLTWCGRFCSGAIRSHRILWWPLKAAQCSGLCFFLLAPARSPSSLYTSAAFRSIRKRTSSSLP